MGTLGLNVSAGVDNIQYTEKPACGYMYDAARKRAAENWGTYDIQWLADYVGNKGHALIAGHLVGGYTNNCCTEQQLFILDFDNDKPEKMVSYGEISERCRSCGLEIAFSYETLSSGMNKDENGQPIMRFRIVLIAPEIIREVFLIKAILKMLLFLFPECDSACQDLARVFMGGKKLIHCNSSARIDWVLFFREILHCFSASGKHRSEEVKRFCRSSGIALVHSLPGIGEMRNLPLILGENVDPSIYTVYRLGESTESPCFVIQATDLTRKHLSHTCSDREHYKADFKGNSACRLLNDFHSGMELDHNQRFLIMTNMLHIHGGIRDFEKTLDAYYPDIADEWKNEDVRYAKMQHYAAKWCSEEDCPYYEACDHSSTIVDTLLSDRKVHCLIEPVYYPLEEAYEHMKRCLKEAYYSDRKGFHMIRAQTGLGKTTAYTEFLYENSSARALIAVPTNRLKEEVRKKMIDKGIPPDEIFMTPHVSGNRFLPIEVQADVAAKHEGGIHSDTSEILKGFRNKIEDGAFEQKNEIDKIISGLEGLKDQRIILTTQAYLLAAPYRLLDGRPVIVDEDILINQIFQRVHTVSVEGLQAVENENIQGYSDLAGYMLSTPCEVYKAIKPLTFASLGNEQKELFFEKSWGNIPDLDKARSFVRHKDDEHGDFISYFCGTEMPFEKYIVMSATADSSVYQQCFPNRDVVDYPEKKCQYAGSLVQYTRHDLGRNSLEKNKGAISAFMKTNFSPGALITFKDYEEDLKKALRIPVSMHFGNTSGSDEMKGKNLAVIGTYFQNQDAYKLVAVTLGAETNNKENKNPRPRRVEYNGFSFIITTYPDPILQKVHLYSIYSEEEQAVGRARLLRNPCEVLVLSAFPCEQALIKTGDYLKEMGKNE